MALITKIRHSATSDFLTLPHSWVEWLSREGYDTEQVDMQILEDGELRILPVRVAATTAERLT